MWEATILNCDRWVQNNKKLRNDYYQDLSQFQRWDTNPNCLWCLYCRQFHPNLQVHQTWYTMLNLKWQLQTQVLETNIIQVSLSLIGPRTGSCFYIKTIFPCMEISSIKVKGLWDHLIIIMRILQLERRQPYNETALRSQQIRNKFNSIFMTWSHYLNLWSPCSMMQIFITRPRWVEFHGLQGPVSI